MGQICLLKEFDDSVISLQMTLLCGHMVGSSEHIYLCPLGMVQITITSPFFLAVVQFWDLVASEPISLVWFTADNVRMLTAISTETGFIYVTTYKIHPLFSHFHSSRTPPSKGQTSPTLVARRSTPPLNPGQVL